MMVQDAKWVAIRECAHERLCLLLTDPVPEVRAAAVYAIGTFIGGSEGSEQRTNIDLNLGLTLPIITADGCPMVRRELVVALGQLVKSYRSRFKEVALELIQEEITLQYELQQKQKKKAAPAVTAAKADNGSLPKKRFTHTLTCSHTHMLTRT